MKNEKFPIVKLPIIPEYYSENWPIKINPLKDETFSSWITRCSLATGNNLRKLLRYYELPGIKFDIDLKYNQKFLNFFSQKSKIDKTLLLDLILIEEKKRIKSLNNRKSIHYAIKEDIWFNHNNWRNKNKIYNGQRYCPLCLQEDKIPYYRKQWKYSFISFCPKHLCLLENKCPVCKKPQSYVALHWNLDLAHCSHCNNSLIDREIFYVKHYGAALKIYKELILSEPIGNDFILRMINLAFFFSKNSSFSKIDEIDKVDSHLQIFYEKKYKKKLDSNQIRLHFFDNIEIFFHYFSYSLILFKYHIKNLHSLKIFFKNYIMRKNSFVNEGFYYCPYDNCDFSSLDVDKILIHYFQEQNQLHNPNFICKLCKKKYAFKSDYDNHKKDHKENEEFICEICKFPTEFATKEGLVLHQKVHYSENSYYCKKCQVKFSSRFQLNKHSTWKHI